MKKVGIITMHRPISFGSSLQAYALQKKISDLGYICEIIDYQYPNKLHKIGQNKLKVFISYIIHYFINLFFGLPCLIESIRFKKFRNKYLKLSQYYKDAQSLINNPPIYDIYCTGSDQVWNSNFTKSDTSFLLSFIENKRKISYASSFAIDYVIKDYHDNYKKYLSQYDCISVRENSGINLVKELTGKEAIHVCDPTLLLTEKDWLPLIKEAKLKIDKPYLLVFMLSYSYNPFPDVNHIIKTVQNELGLHTIVLSGTKYDYFRKNTTVIKNAGPNEFLYLFKNASFIITSSFHGVAFATNFEKPFYAIIKNENADSRLISTLKTLGLEDRAIEYNEKIKCLKPFNKSAYKKKLETFREQSLNYLNNSLQK